MRIGFLLAAVGAAAYALWPDQPSRSVPQATASLGPPPGLKLRGGEAPMRTAVFSWPSELREGREFDVTVELVPPTPGEAALPFDFQVAGEHLEIALLAEGFELRVPSSQRRSVRLDPGRNVISWQLVPKQADTHALRFVFTDERGNIRPLGRTEDPTFRPAVASGGVELRRVFGLLASSFFGFVGFSQGLLEAAPVYRWLRKRLSR